MTLKELLEVANDDAWAVIVESGGKHHTVYVADYVAGWKDAVRVLEPLLDKEIVVVTPEVISDPEPDDPEDVGRVSALWIDLAKEYKDGKAES